MTCRAPLVALALGAWLAGTAAARDRQPAPMPAAAIESCVDHQAIRFQPGDRRAILDVADAALVAAHLVRRYPVVERDGLAPGAIVLWRRPGADWLYVALLEDPAKPDRYCFTATFVATRIDVTRSMVAKYFGASAAVD